MDESLFRKEDLAEPLYTSEEIEGRAFFRDLTTDAQGRVILVGLTYEETRFQVAYNRWAWRHRRTGPREGEPETLDRLRKRYLELHEKHQFARFQVMHAERYLQANNPTRQ